MKYGLIGERLNHSFSPEIHRQLCDYEYGLMEMSLNEMRTFIENRAFLAVNITVPYKELVIPLLNELDETAQRIGAVNTVINKDGRLIGYNTDYAGLYALIIKSGISLCDKKVLILGSGGTSRTALAVAEDLGCREAIRVSRDEKDGCVTYSQAMQEHCDAEIIINTTPCGMYPDVGDTPISLDAFSHLCGVVDVIYNPVRTQLLCDALTRGIPAVGGLYMLVVQAAAAAQLFTGKPVSAEMIDKIHNRIMCHKQNVVLIGMPGCGKSTIGRQLSKKLNMPLFDTDAVIQEAEGRSIAEVFADDGESYFRVKESDVLAKLSSKSGVVIATGGGVVLNPDNISLLRKNGRIYFLDRPLERLQISPDRPLSATAEDMAKRYTERYALYKAACDKQIDVVDEVTIVVNEVVEDWYTWRN